jgi:hypothetical protein
MMSASAPALLQVLPDRRRMAHRFVRARRITAEEHFQTLAKTATTFVRITHDAGIVEPCDVREAAALAKALVDRASKKEVTVFRAASFFDGRLMLWAFVCSPETPVTTEQQYEFCCTLRDMAIIPHCMELLAPVTNVTLKGAFWESMRSCFLDEECKTQPKKLQHEGVWYYDSVVRSNR